ncbi:MAG: biopolymer transporter ExbD [Pseudomonadota bacterium]
MRITRRMLRQYKRSSTEHEEIINLVPFIDILTILVIYLLVGAVSPHLAALDLNLPSSQTTTVVSKKQPLQLTIALKKDGFIVNDRSGRERRLARNSKGYDLRQLGQTLLQIKQQHSDETTVTLLLEPDIAYDLLVQVMDTARLTPVTRKGQVATEMFPDISIGDAPK